mmetsp:Transcript_5881/g.10434  ORF Transcript_5881/g.10434 Transcript_5881/m.10434 type:complete len:388 (-) Transcript_5881:330-1493(-)
MSSEGSSLYVGNLDGRVCNELLYEVFSLVAPVVQCKVVGDRSTGQSLGFGFVDFGDRETASRALEMFTGRTLFGRELRIDWAHSGGGAASKPLTDDGDTARLFTLFVGNLSPDIDDTTLFDAFSTCGTVTSAKLHRDPDTRMHAGYGFVAFRDRAHAQRAVDDLNGATIGQKQIRVDWARSRTAAIASGAVNAGEARSMAMPGSGLETEAPLAPSLEALLASASETNVTMYMSGLPSGVEEEDIRDALADFDGVEEIRIPDSTKQGGLDRAYAFVRFSTHDEAGAAIFHFQRNEMCGRRITANWGREARSSRAPNAGGMHGPPGMMPGSMMGMAPPTRYPHAPIWPPPGANGPSNWMQGQMSRNYPSFPQNPSRHVPVQSASRFAQI